jgi:hypothetical protein
MIQAAADFLARHPRPSIGHKQSQTDPEAEHPGGHRRPLIGVPIADRSAGIGSAAPSSYGEPYVARAVTAPSLELREARGRNGDDMSNQPRVATAWLVPKDFTEGTAVGITAGGGQRRQAGRRAQQARLGDGQDTANPARAGGPQGNALPQTRRSVQAGSPATYSDVKPSPP